MKFFNKKGKLLRLRPGPLANFSGGASYAYLYMISTLAVAVPVSILFGIVSSIVLFFTCRAMEKRHFRTSDRLQPVSLNTFVVYVHIHIIACVILTILLTFAVFVVIQNPFSGEHTEYVGATIIFALLPMIFTFVSMLYLVKLLMTRGAEWICLFLAASVHVILLTILLTATCFPIFISIFF